MTIRTSPQHLPFANLGSACNSGGFREYPDEESGMSAKLRHTTKITLVNPWPLTTTTTLGRSHTYVLAHCTSTACEQCTSVCTESCRQHHESEEVWEVHVTKFNLKNDHGPVCTPNLDRYRAAEKVSMCHHDVFVRGCVAWLSLLYFSMVDYQHGI